VSAHINHAYVLKEAALLFESGSYKALDKIISVFTPLDLRIQRITTRDTHRTIQEIQAIISKQISEEYKRQKADYVIVNDEKHLVIPQVLALHNEFMVAATSGK
jgi:dephospho-CoA kinase